MKVITKIIRIAQSGEYIELPDSADVIHVSRPSYETIALHLLFDSEKSLGPAKRRFAFVTEGRPEIPSAHHVLHLGTIEAPDRVHVFELFDY